MEPSPQHGAPGEAAGLGPRLAGPALFALAFALYAWTFDVLHDGQLLGNDAMPYAHQLAQGDPLGLFNAHHLLFHVLTLGLAKGKTLAGSGFDELTILGAQQLLSALGGALAVLAVFRFAARASGVLLGALVAGVFAVSFGPWLYSAVGETYSTATAFTALLLVHAAESALGWRRENVLVLALWLLVAVCMRQDAVLVVLALPLLLRPSTTLLVTVGAGALALLVYVLAWAGSGLEVPFREWLMGLASESTWGLAPGLAEAGTSAGVLLTTLSSGTIHWRHALSGDLRTLSEPTAWASLASVVLLALPLARPGRSVPSAGRVLAAFGLLALARFAFYTWWQPGNLEYHTGTLLPLFLALGLACDSARPRRTAGLLAAALVLVAGTNLFGAVLPNRVTDAAERSRLAAEEARPGGVVVAMTANQLHAFLREPPEDVFVHDGVGLFVRRDAGSAPALWNRVRDTLERGDRVVFVRELGLWSRLGFPERPLQTDALLAELSSWPTQTLADEDGAPWGLVVEP